MLDFIYLKHTILMGLALIGVLAKVLFDHYNKKHQSK
jgi:hypothetical protein